MSQEQQPGQSVGLTGNIMHVINSTIKDQELLSAINKMTSARTVRVLRASAFLRSIIKITIKYEELISNNM
uniref:Uncharacterized protein n=1 Tax=Anopheles atroparvus TaxID=41427 RepID=A0AAG5D4I7_ANOAO